MVQFVREFFSRTFDGFASATERSTTTMGIAG